jgi:hypothetical protein
MKNSDFHVPLPPGDEYYCLWYKKGTVNPEQLEMFIIILFNEKLLCMR